MLMLLSVSHAPQAIGPKDNDQGNCDAAADALNAKLGTAGDQPTPWGLGFQCFDGGIPWAVSHLPPTPNAISPHQPAPAPHNCTTVAVALLPVASLP